MAKLRRNVPIYKKIMKKNIYIYIYLIVPCCNKKKLPKRSELYLLMYFVDTANKRITS